ncbi:hypothetical protein ACWF0M_31160 [Kribbella sp. NPDC055110]
MTGEVNEISPQSWEYRLVAAVVYAVERRVGGGADGPRSRWNGRLLEETDEEALGAADPDGALWVSVADVLEPLRQARDLDRPLTDYEALKVRDAMATLTHEAAHLMAPSGDPEAPEAYPYDDSAYAFDEGRIEHWTLDNLDLVIEDVFTKVGLEEAAAVVQSQEDIDAYPAYTAAVRDIDEALAERGGLTGEEVTHQLMCTDDAQRWNVAVDLVIDKRLAEPDLMPEAHRAEVRKQLVAPLRDALVRLVEVEADESLESEQQSDEATKVARQAVAALDKELGRIEGDYRSKQQVQLSPEFKRLQEVTGGQAAAVGATGRSVGGADRGPAAPDSGSRGQQRPRRPVGPHTPRLG